MGMGIAIPHGTNAAKDKVKKPALSSYSTPKAFSGAKRRHISSLESLARVMNTLLFWPTSRVHAQTRLNSTHEDHSDVNTSSIP
jgi:hypothetical protein